VISICDMFKVGIGPSSSHTVGPMKAAKQFVSELEIGHHLANIDRISVEVYGSLALTGRGHHTDIAIILGLQAASPVDVDIASIPAVIQKVQQQQQLLLAGQYWVQFPHE
jgi:L-serine dehydratase